MIPLYFTWAVATGNTVIVKPSEHCPLTTIRMVELAEEAGNNELALSILQAKATFFREQKRYNEAIQTYRRALALAREANDATQSATLLEAIASIQALQKQYAASSESYREAATLWRQVGERGKEARAIGAVGGNYQAQGDVAKALELYAQSHSLATQARDYELAAQVYQAEGNLLQSEKRNDEAMEAFDAALKMAAQTGNRSLQANIYESLGLMQQRRGQYGDAAASYEQAMQFRRGSGDWKREQATRYRLWQAYLLSNQYDKALAITGEPVGISKPAEGAVVRGEVAVEGLAMHPAFKKYQLDLLLNSDEGQVTNIGVGWWPAWGTLKTFDSTQYPNGEHELRLRVVREGANYDEYFRTITIQN
jgi:tetratricopeptide (TPR) repeat protein